MARYALRRLGVSTAEAEAIAQGLRGRTAFGERRPAERPLQPGERLRERFRSAGRRPAAETAPDPPAQVAGTERDPARTVEGAETARGEDRRPAGT